MFDNYPDIVAIEDVMDMLHVGKSTAYSLLRSNSIPHEQVYELCQLERLRCR